MKNPLALLCGALVLLACQAHLRADATATISGCPAGIVENSGYFSASIAQSWQYLIDSSVFEYLNGQGQIAGTSGGVSMWGINRGGTDARTDGRAAFQDAILLEGGSAAQIRVLAQLTASGWGGGGYAVANVWAGGLGRTLAVGSGTQTVQWTCQVYAPGANSVYHDLAVSLIPRAYCRGPWALGLDASLSIQVQSLTPGVNATRATLADVLRNSVDIPLALRQATHDHPYPGPISATFRPNRGLSVDEVAHLYGFDHFNWVQTFKLPPGYDLYCRTAQGERIGPLAQPALDPAPVSGSRYIVRAPDGQECTVALQPGFDDSRDFYFGEAQPDLLGGLNGALFNGALGFSDAPGFEQGYFREGDLLEFETKLAGVRADGSYTSFEDVNTSFRWKTHAVYQHNDIFDILIFAMADDGTLPPLLSGGVYDVQFDPVPLRLSAALDQAWCYQNAPVTTLNRHHCRLTLAVPDDPDNTSYTVSVTENPSSSGHVVIEPTGDPLVWNLQGGRHGADPAGLALLDIAVTGRQLPSQAAATVALVVRPLADITGDGAVSGSDKLEMNKRLNGLDTSPYNDPRFFDLNGDGLVSGADKLILNKILNGLPLP